MSSMYTWQVPATLSRQTPLAATESGESSGLGRISAPAIVVLVPGGGSGGRVGLDELLAHLGAAISDGDFETQPKVAVGDVEIDMAAKVAIGKDGERVGLTPTEWRLLEQLMRRPGRLVSAETLFAALRGGPEHTDPSYLRTYIFQLRRKLEPEPNRPRHLITVPGMGYRFQP
ncbi:winged helix-turn-helix domain-containing protein [Jatrophihabitans sp. DSM 45814]